MYEDMTMDVIMEEMMEEMPDGLDTSEGSLIYHSCAKHGARLEEVYTELSALVDNQYSDTADLDHLVRFGQEKGVYIEEATPAQFEGVFNATVPIGTEFSGDDYNYIVTDVINEEEHKYRLECEDAGTEPNGWTGDLMCLDDIDELEDAQLTKLLVPGTDEEDEESYRMRIEDSFGIKPFAGNKAYYKEEVEAIDGVGGEKTYRRKGSSISTVIISDEYRKASKELIDSVQTQVDPVQNHGEGIGIAPIGHAVIISTVNEYTVNVSAVATYDTGYSAEGLKTQIEDAIEEYMLSLRKTWVDTTLIIVRRAAIENIDEIMAIYAAEEKVGQRLEKEIRDRDLDTCIRTATEYGISRREKILKIQPQDTDSLEDRRFRVLIKWYDDYPYTYNDLLNRLNNLLGNGNYTLVVLPEEMELKCLVELTRKQMYADFEKLMDEIVPMNMTMDIGLRYNQHETLHAFTHDYLKKYTHEQVRNTVLKGE